LLDAMLRNGGIVAILLQEFGHRRATESGESVKVNHPEIGNV
jgi:hypothetical protein